MFTRLPANLITERQLNRTAHSSESFIKSTQFTDQYTKVNNILILWIWNITIRIKTIVERNYANT